MSDTRLLDRAWPPAWRRRMTSVVGAILAAGALVATEAQTKDDFAYWDANGNGDLTCTEARGREEGLRLPAYRDNRNGTGVIYEWLERQRSSHTDNDGIACESTSNPNGYVPGSAPPPPPPPPDPPPPPSRECPVGSPTWMGLPVCEEGVRVGYDRNAFGSAYSSLEDEIIAGLPKSGGQVYAPYTCTLFDIRVDIRADGTAATDIEHIVALAEAYDSGLAESQFLTFAGDLDNLTIADPTVNRTQKSDRDAAEWGPPQNSGWFAARVVAVKQKYTLSVNPAERDALQAMLNSDASRTVTCGGGMAETTPDDDVSTATQSDETAKRFHVFPQLADGGGWQSSLLVTNAAQSTNLCMFELHGLSLERFYEDSGVTVSGSTATFEMPGSGGYRVWRTKNKLALASGYATLDCAAPVVAQVLYGSEDGSGTTTGMATVFSSQAGGVFQFPVLTPEARLGIAIANDTNTDASCRVVLEGPYQQRLGEATLPVASQSNVARFLYEAISIPDGFTEGSATVSCDQGVSVIGLQFAGAIFTTLPPTILDLPPQPSDETAKLSHVFPQLADGGGWQSVLLVTNASQSTNLCTLELHGLTIDRFEDRGTTATGSTATFTLIAPAGYLVWPTKNESALASGYATLDCTDPVVAQVLYASRDGSGTTTGMATVFSSQAGGVFQFPVLTPDASLGIAIANDTNTGASCGVALKDPDRLSLGDSTISIPSKSNVARFLSQIIQTPPGFAGGSATISCDQQVAVIGLQFAGAVFTTLPPPILAATARSTPPGPTKPFNQQQTERLIGRWVFSYRFASSEFTPTYTLSDVQENSRNPGEWSIFGTNQYDDPVVAGYSAGSGRFSLFDPDTSIERFFTFDFVGSSTTSVSGCAHHQLDPDASTPPRRLSHCKIMRGVRTSLSTIH